MNKVFLHTPQKTKIREQKKLKRLLSLVLAMIIVLSMRVSVFADESTQTSPEEFIRLWEEIMHEQMNQFNKSERFIDRGCKTERGDRDTDRF